MEKKTFILFRHGETDLNALKMFQGCGVDADLNETGRKQALELKEKLKPYGIQIVYTSPLKRAMTTAMLAFDKDMPVSVEPDLREAHLGKAEGMFKADVEKNFPEIWKHWYTANAYMDTRFPEGESKQEIGNRIKNALLKIASREPAEVIGISIHSAAIRCFLMPLGRKDEPMQNCAIFQVEFDGKDFKLVK